MQTTTDEPDDTRTEWNLLLPTENNGVGWKLTHTDDSEVVRMVGEGQTIEDDEFTIPLAYIDRFVSGLQETYWESTDDEWEERDWTFSTGVGDLSIVSREGEYETTLRNNSTLQQVRFTPSLFDPMLPGFDEARYDLTEEVDTEEGEFHVFYQQDEQDHILYNGSRVCSHTATLDNRPEVKSIEELSNRELSLLANGATNLCGYCERFLNKNGLLDGTNLGELPRFECPECGDDAVVVQQHGATGEVEHEDGTKHEFDFTVYENWRRGKDVEQLPE